MHKFRQIVTSTHGRQQAPVVTEVMKRFMWVGSKLDAENTSFLLRNHITHVLNAGDWESEAAIRVPGIKYLTLGAMDMPGYPILYAHYPKADAFLLDAHVNRGRVLVHCMAGINRSVSIAMAFLLQRADADVLQVAQLLAHNRIILTNPWFCEQVLQLAHSVHGARAG